MLNSFILKFIETPYADIRILGRPSRDYLRREFAAFDCAGDACEAAEETSLDCADAPITVCLPLDMPLVRVEDVMRAIESMRRKKIGFLTLGEPESGAFIRRGGESGGGYRLSGEVFCKVDSAKNRSMVYNSLRQRIATRLLASGAEIPDTLSVHIDDTVEIAPGAEILPFTRLTGATRIGPGAKVEAAYAEDSVIGACAHVFMSHLARSRVGARTTVGPFARLRDADIAEDCRVGDFVEIKASELERGAKSAHLAYIGDARVGEDTNVGCGTVFCNYDGVNKHRTEVGCGCFIGANTNLVAPLKVGDGAFIAAGTTVTRNVERDEFVIGRARQENKSKKRE